MDLVASPLLGLETGFAGTLDQRDQARAICLRSAIYEGAVAHTRLAPVQHAFTYRLALLAVDLDELPTLFSETKWWRCERSAPASFRRSDYLPGPDPLAETVRALVAERIGHRPLGAITLLCHPRYFGGCFNPVVFFYCYAPDGSLDAIVAEITNTPWRDRFSYVCDCRGKPADDLRFVFPKAFHVSPFMALDQEYAWRFGVSRERMTVRMENREAGRLLFHADMSLTRHEATPQALDRLLLRQSFLTLRILTAIYGQAARLWWKGAPFHPHPAATPRSRPQGNAP